ncbi:MAG: hybrid sensor histidine kinase/response regulator [Phycisphaerae bacterium]|nr:hybrid sensor histidine kinase/response regulator [Phycisphaerae bacterium]
MSETQIPLRVLVVDDEEGMRLGAARVIRGLAIDLPNGQGQVVFELSDAAGGEEALQQIETSRPDILLLDHKMNGISGLEVLERIGGEDGGILTIMITAYASLETAILATKRGAYDFLAKPFTPEDLRGTLRKAVKHLMLQRRARQLAEEKRRVRFEFISILAHEMKAPLAAVEGYLNLLADRTLGEQLPAYDEMIHRCSVRMEGMRKLIFELLNLTRIESGLKKRTWEQVDVAAAARACLETFSPEAQKRDIRLELDAPESLVMAADRGELDILLNNLISNAVKYNRDGGTVTAVLRADEETVTLSVSDTGIGLSPDERDRLFGDFVRIRNDKTRNILGTGLGLSTARKLARLYDGDIVVESTPDVGSTFTVTLGRNTQPEFSDASTN